MNSCILMAQIIQEPQLRYTGDTQTPIAEMLVEFEGLGPDDPPATLKVIGWGDLAQKIQQTYHTGDRIILEGRLNMNTIDRQEGFKEKRAELVVGKIYNLNGDVISSTPPNSDTLSPQPPAATFTPKSNVVPLERRTPSPQTSTTPTTTPSKSTSTYSPSIPASTSTEDYDFHSSSLPNNQPDDDPIPF